MAVSESGFYEPYLSTDCSLSKNAIAEWRVVITIETDEHANHLNVSVRGSTALKFSTGEAMCDHDLAEATAMNPESRLRESLPNTLDLTQILNELRALEAIYTYCYPSVGVYVLTYPSFNAHGDVLFELHPHDQRLMDTNGGNRPRQNTNVSPKPRFDDGSDATVSGSGAHKSVSTDAMHDEDFGRLKILDVPYQSQ